MKQRPILFSTEMVKAILEGRKTQTRRTRGLETFNSEPQEGWRFIGMYNNPVNELHAIFETPVNGDQASAMCPYGKPGDVLWVRETFRKVQNYGVDYPIYQYKDEEFSEAWINGRTREIFIEQSIFGKWKPSIHMPKAAARIWLEITNVRVERLQDISDKDAVSEGIEAAKFMDEPNGETCYRVYNITGNPTYAKESQWSPEESFMTLWASINGPESWASNPWLWVIEFKRIEKPKA